MHQLPQLDRRKPTLTVLLGEQPVPTLVDFDPALFSRVVLLASGTTEPVAYRLRRLLQNKVPDLEVAVAGVDHLHPQELMETVRHIIDHSDGMTRQLNGGTKLMALAAYQAAADQDVTMSYVVGKQVTDIQRRMSLERQWFPVDPEELFALHGVQLTGQRPDPYKEDLFQVAQRVTADWKNEDLLDEFLKLWRKRYKFKPFFEQGISKRQRNNRIAGKAREYNAYWQANRALKQRGVHVINEPAISICEWDGQQKKDISATGKGGSSLKKTPDLVLVNGYDIYVIEVKPNLSDAFSEKNSEQHDTYLFGEFLGRFSKGLVLASHLLKNENRRIPEDARERRGFKFDWYVLRGTDEQNKKVKKANIYLFPDDFLSAAPVTPPAASAAERTA
ncbi:hypothetical protein EJ104_12990 [Deinococcus radiophilus]|uniref:DUF1887 family protein n=1 Tax=Deinococcus radiophilus TaxID=32062 RepID=A0A431VIW4_9DEIO|nr:hypothetical protein EJ104_12990 [Deinococcus radiophilus]